MIRCLDPSCGKDGAGKKRKRDGTRSLHPRELLAMGIPEDKVRRYVEIKRKKRLEADKSTVYCPRTWCQGPAKSLKYPPIPKDLTEYPSSESSDGEDDTDDGRSTRLNAPGNTATSPKSKKPSAPDPNDRLAVCEKCSLAFCRVCYMGWHGPFARCYPRDPSELSAEEKASYDYIRTHTSPCPYCSSPTQKTMGCNHMICFQCKTHFCYLCGSWLNGENPYQHFNKAGTPCYQRLWELEEGDEGHAPEDGMGFAGGRGWEQLAIEAAREAEAEEAAAAAAAAAALVANPPPRYPDPAPLQPARDRDRPNPDLQRAMAQLDLGEEHGRRQQDRNAQRRPHLGDVGIYPLHEIRRFVDMARLDEEDGWDSDELGDDERFEIR